MTTEPKELTTEPIAKATADFAGASKIRWVCAFLVFLLALVCYLDRILFSVCASPIMKSLSITPVQFGLVISLFSAAYGIFQIPGGMLAQRFGSRLMVSLSLVFWSLFTTLTGMVNSLMSLGVVRLMFGMGEAPFYPASNYFFSNWMAKNERGRAASLMNGGSFLANVVGPPVIVALVALAGWQMSFVVFGVLGVVLAVVWYVCTRNWPAEHPWTNEQEREFIAANSANAGRAAFDKKVVVKTPWGLLMRQRSFWALAAGYFGTLWTVQFFNYWLPYYLQAAKGLSFKNMGFYTSVPWIFMVISIFTAGTVSDSLLKIGLSRFWARNMVCVTGLCISAVALVCSTKAASVTGNILWLSLALGMAGVSQTVSWTISADIGGLVTATVGAWMNMWGFIAATIVPTLAPIIAKVYGWNQVWIMNACVMLIGIAGLLLIKSDETLRITPVGERPVARGAAGRA
jgi:ACS family glucarate transporter-like MFS transporter